MGKRAPGEPTPYAKAKAEIADLRTERYAYQAVLTRRVAGAEPDITRVWEGAKHSDPGDAVHDTTVTINWWGSCRADEGYIEIVIDQGERLPTVNVYPALAMRDMIRNNRLPPGPSCVTYHAPWRYDVENMLAIPLSHRECRVEGCRYHDRSGS